MVERIQLIRNIGQFESFTSSSQLNLEELTLFYAENGRGKTTLANIFRSLGTNNPVFIEERQRLGTNRRPHVVVQENGQAVTYQNGAWQSYLPDIAIFDDSFVAQNVCSGIEIESSHRQNLHELIIGAHGVALNAILQTHVSKIEQHNRAIREKEAAIAASVRGNMSVDEFCALPSRTDIEKVIQETQRNLDAAKAADAIRQRDNFQTLELPSFDTAGIDTILQRDLPDLQQDAARKVQQHLATLGKDAEAWIGDGMNKIAGASNGKEHEICPFCAQNLQTSPLIIHYQGYFSKGYATLKKDIIDYGKALASAHHVDIQTAFERNIQAARQTATFWQQFIDMPTIEIDTIEIARAWKAAREPILDILRAKAAAPLEKMSLSTEILTAVAIYEKHRQTIAALSRSLQDCNAKIATVKERTAGANVAALNADMSKLELTQQRQSPSMAELCKAYQDEKDAKKITEKNREQARQELDNYRSSIFQTYQNAINSYLHKFLAGFRLQSMTSQNTRGGTSCTYTVLINTVPVPLSSDSGPSFRNTLSAGDRNTLALAFFFASLDKDPGLSQKIVLIDDPMTSLDEHRSLATINEIIGLIGRVKQVIVLSHSKPFLCMLWNDSERAIKGTPKSALQIIRTNDSSAIDAWNVHQDCITEHDKRHALITDYVQRCDSNKQREVATALRPSLEAFLRVAYPGNFPPGTLLGTFLNTCSHAVNTGKPILGQADIKELTQLMNYANKFHHDTNPAYATEIINDQTLLSFCQRTLNFTKRN